MRRALLMASGANRGAYYAGFLEPLRDAGIDFGLMAGVSAGGIASAWFAAGDPEALVEVSLEDKGTHRLPQDCLRVLDD